MKPQARPFTVEVKSKRRPLQASQTNWSTVVDEPSPDDLPIRDVRDDAPDTPFAAAGRVFKAFATNATSSASTLGDLAASVFPPKPQEHAGDTAPAIAVGRTGRVLPSLLPVNPFETASVQEDGPVGKKRTAKRPRKRDLEVAEQPKMPDTTEAPSASASNATLSPELTVTAEPPRAGKPTRRRADARVRAGEGWKRRRLPKACW